MTKSKWARISRGYIAQLETYRAEFAAVKAASDRIREIAAQIKPDDTLPLTPQEARTVKEFQSTIDRLHTAMQRLERDMQRHSALAEAWT